MRRVLYVEGGGVAGVRKDGESLVVQVAGQAERRYPFRLLSRVILRGDTSIHAAAIWGLLSAGVPITLQSRNGEPCGFGLPYRLPRQGPTEWAECLLENPDGRDRWRSWILARERTEIRRVYREQEWQANDWRPLAVEKDLTRRSLSDVLAGLAERKSAIAGELVTRFTEEGLPPALLARMERQIQVLSDLTRMLSWHFWAEAIEGPTESGGAAADWERDRAVETTRIQRSVRQFLYWLEGSAWHDRNDRHGW